MDGAGGGSIYGVNRIEAVTTDVNGGVDADAGLSEFRDSELASAANRGVGWRRLCGGTEPWRGKGDYDRCRRARIRLLLMKNGKVFKRNGRQEIY